MKKPIYKSLLITLTIIIIFLASFGITRALFNDIEQSHGNAVNSGVINLKVGESDPTTFHFQFDNVMPGEMRQSFTTVESTGISGNFWLDIFALNSSEGTNQEPETDTTGDGELDKCSELKIVATDPLGSEYTVLDWTALPLITQSIDLMRDTQIDSLLATQKMEFNFQLRSDSCGNEAMGDGFDLNIDFHLDQV